MAPTPRRELTEHEKGMIEAYRNTGCKINEIAHATNLKPTTVKSFLQRVKKRGSWENLSRVGRPRKTSITDDRLLVRKAQILSSIPLKQLRAEANSSLSVKTIRRRLAENNIRKWRAARRPRLTKGHVEKRYKWAKEHLKWTEADWRKIGWSDECSVEKSADPRGVWVSRHPGKKEKYLPKNVIPKDKSGGVSLMVWGCFIGDKKSQLAPMYGKQNADAYIVILRENLIPFIETLPQHVQRDFVFQQDNAKIHTAFRTMDFFEEHSVIVMEWPPNSPDMNPIEHVWHCLKTTLHRQFPDTPLLGGAPDTVRRSLGERLIVVWDSIGAERLDRLIASMPRRVRALYEAKGWYTPY